MTTPTVAESGAGEDFFQLLYRGGELLAGGNATEAKDYLEKALGLEPEDEKGRNLLGLTYFKLGLFDRAAQLYEGLVQENPADPTLRVNLGLVYLKTNALSRAIHEFATATDLAPDHHKAHNYLGLALAQAGQHEKARQHFLAAGSQAMADKMAEAIAAQPVTATDGPAGGPAPLAGDGLDSALAAASGSATPEPRIWAGVDPPRDETETWRESFEELEAAPAPAPAAVLAAPGQPDAGRRAGSVSAWPEPGAESPLAVRLTDLARAVGVLRQPLIEPFEIRLDLVLISVRGELLTRLSGLTAHGGRLELTPERKQFRGRLTDRSFGEGPEQMVRARGSGVLILDARKRTFVAAEIAGESAYFKEGAVFAFEGALSFENGRLPSEVTPDLDLVYLRGDGQVLLCCAAPLRSLEVIPTRPATVPLDGLVGWYGNLTPRIAVLALDEGGRVLRAGVELSGDGFVLFSSPLS